MAGKVDLIKEIPIGGTYFGGNTPDSTSGAHLEGSEVEIELRNMATNPAPDYGVHAGGRVRLMAVRNVSGINLLPGRLVCFKNTSGLYGSQVDGYPTTTAAQFAGVVDPFLPAAGVANNDIFWIVIAGPVLCLSPLTGNGDNVWSGGDALVAITAATSQCTTAGRLIAQDLTGATALLANQVQNKVGRAMSACTTAETNTSKLVYIRGV